MTDFRVWPGRAYPLGATYDGVGTNFSVFSEPAEQVELCLFDADGSESRVATPRVDGLLLARLPARHRAWSALWLPRARPVGSVRWRPGSTRQAAPRSVRQGGRGRGALERSGVRTRWPTPPSATTTTARRSCRSPSSSTRTSTGSNDRPLQIPVEETRHLRGPRQGRDGRAPRRRARAAGPLRRHRPSRVRRAPPRLGVTTVELLPVHQFVHDSHLVDLGLRNYWGYNSIAFLAPHNDYARRADRRAGAGVPADGEGPPRRRHRGHPRRRLQPHRRGQPPRTDAGHEGLRQRRVLPAGRRRPVPLLRLHRHRQQPQHAPPAHVAVGDGQPPLLGHRDARRRLPLRPGRRPWRAVCTLSTGSPPSSTSCSRTRWSAR